MRQAVKALLIFLLLPIAAFAIAAFPSLEFRRFTETPSVDPALTNRVLAVIDGNSDFRAGQFITDVSDEVCSWASAEKLQELVKRPGWQLTAGNNGDVWFKKTNFWPWERHGLVLALRNDPGCSARVHRSDTI